MASQDIIRYYILDSDILGSHYGHGILWETPNEHTLLHFALSKSPTASETQLEKSASGIQWSTESCPSPYNSKPLGLGDSKLGTSFN